MTSLQQAKALALIVPTALLAGAYGFEHLGGLYPCELCWWQRWAHFTALFCAALALISTRLPDRGRSFVWLAALAILTSGGVGGYHAGVEAGLFEGFTQCTSPAVGASVEEMLDAVFDAPVVRCDEVPWSFLGISMAGWNAIVSILFGLVILWLSLRRPRPNR